MGAYLTRRDALQLPKELSLAVEEGRWKLLEVFNVSLPSDMLLLTEMDVLFPHFLHTRALGT